MREGRRAHARVARLASRGRLSRRARRRATEGAVGSSLPPKISPPRGPTPPQAAPTLLGVPRGHPTSPAPPTDAPLSHVHTTCTAGGGPPRSGPGHPKSPYRNERVRRGGRRRAGAQCRSKTARSPNLPTRSERKAPPPAHKNLIRAAQRRVPGRRQRGSVPTEEPPPPHGHLRPPPHSPGRPPADWTRAPPPFGRGRPPAHPLLRGETRERGGPRHAGVGGARPRFAAR